MIACPKCGATDFKEVKENVLQTYKACSNCKYAPALEKAEPQDAKKWVEEIAKEHAEVQEQAYKAEQEIHDLNGKASILQVGRLNKAKRLLAASDKKMIVAEGVSEIVEATESGQITLLIPELGLYQFEWGDFSLFKAIGKEK